MTPGPAPSPLQSILDALTDPCLVLDPQSIIVGANAAWRAVAGASPLLDPRRGLGTSYLEGCAHALAQGLAEAATLADAIRAVLAGRETEVSVEYAWHGPTAERWFTMRVAALTGAGVGRAIVTHRDVSALRRAERVGESLAEMGRELAGTLNPDQVTGRVVASLRHLFGLRRAVLYRLEPGNSTLVAVATAGDGEDERWIGRTLPLGAGAAGRAVQERRPIWSSHPLTDRTLSLPRWAVERAREEGLELVAGIPLIARGEVLGAIELGRARRRPFSAEDLRLLAVFADQAALVLQSAQFHARALGRVRELAALVEVSYAVTNTLDYLGVAHAVTEATQMLLPGGACHLWELVPGREELRVLAAAGFSGTSEAVAVRPLRVGEGVAGVAAQTRRPVSSIDLRGDPRVANAEWLAGEGLVSGLTLPLIHGGVLYGILSLFTRSRHDFSPDEVRLLESFAAQAAGAIANARLFSGSERRRQAAEDLAELGGLLSSLDPQVVGRQAVESVRRLLAAQMAAIYRLEPESGDLVLFAASEVAPDTVDWNWRLPRGTAMVGRAVTEGGPVVTADLLSDPRVTLSAESRERIERSRYRAALAVPLRVRTAVFGGLVVGDHAGRVFTDEDARVVRAFADQAAIALENARLYQNTRQAYEDLARAQNELLHSQKMEAIGRLAGGVAHDFNNLLTVIIGRAHLLETRLGGVDLRDIHLLYRTALRAADLTEQLLTFSRKQARQPRMLDLNEVVTSMSSLLRRLIGEHVELSTRTAPDLGQVEADPAQIEQVIMNLAVNARDAMPEGGRLEIETADVHVGPSEIRRHPVLEPGRYVVLAVTDTGCGMDGGTQERIFEPFFTTKDVGKGTGLGLAMVYGIVKQSGGHITVESEPDRGSRLTVFLPRVADPAPAPLAAEPAATPLTGDETILLVEDEPDVRALARQILSARGYLVLEAADAQSALALCDQHPGPIDLMLTDVVMPRMSGWQLARALAGRRPATKVLFMSGYPRSQILRNPTAGADFELLSKPFSPSSLAGRVREALDRPLPAAPDPTS